MARTLNPLYGDYINDTTIAKAAVSRPGFVIAPTFSQSAGPGNSITVTLTQDADLGIWAWKTRWIQGQGSFNFVEDSPIAVVSQDATANPYQLLVARWKWVQGPLDVDAHPTGNYISAMDPIYEFEVATANDMPEDLLFNPIAQPTTSAQFGVVLGTLDYGVFSLQAATMLDLAKLATQHMPIASFIEIALAGTGGVATHLDWRGASSYSNIGYGPEANGSGDIVIFKDGYYKITGVIQQLGGGNIISDYTVKLNGAVIGPSGNASGALYLYPFLWAGKLQAGDVISMTYGTNAAGGAAAFFAFERI